MRAPFAPPRLSDPRKVDAEAQAVETNCETVSPEARTFAFRARDILIINQRMIHGGMGSCQSSSSFGTSGPR